MDFFLGGNFSLGKKVNLSHDPWKPIYTLYTYIAFSHFAIMYIMQSSCSDRVYMQTDYNVNAPLLHGALTYY